MSDRHIDGRRNFLLAAFSILPMVAACETDKVKSVGKGEEYDISTAPELSQVGGAVKKMFGEKNGGNPLLIVRIAQDDFSVLSAICTHQGCEVNLPKTADQVVCPCHKSTFSTRDGSVITGLASAPLRKYPVTFNSKTNKLTIAF